MNVVRLDCPMRPVPMKPTVTLSFGLTVELDEGLSESRELISVQRLQEQPDCSCEGNRDVAFSWTWILPYVEETLEWRVAGKGTGMTNDEARMTKEARSQYKPAMSPDALLVH